MADTVLNTTVFDGAKKLITHYNVVSDSSGSTTKIVDVSGFYSAKIAKNILNSKREKANEVRSLMKAFVLATPISGPACV